MMDGRDERTNPLYGRCGEGLPLAPPGWRWVAGKRPTDMYFFSPSGERFRSRSQLESYLARTPHSPSPTDFRWRASPSEFEHGLPGVPFAGTRITKKGKSQTAKKKVTKNSSKKRKRKLKFYRPHLISKKNTFHSKKPKMSHSTLPSPPLTVFGKVSIDEDRGKLLASSFEKWCAENSQLLHKLFPGYIKEVNDVSMEELRRILVTSKYSSEDLRSCSESVLQLFVLLLRNEDISGSLDRDRLVELCIDWCCKHKHPWCLREAGRIQYIVSTSGAQLSRQFHKSGSGQGGLNQRNQNLSFEYPLDPLRSKHGLSEIEAQAQEFVSRKALIGSDIRNRPVGSADAISSGRDELDEGNCQVSPSESLMQDDQIKEGEESILHMTKPLKQMQVETGQMVEAIVGSASNLLKVKEKAQSYEQLSSVMENLQTQAVPVKASLEPVVIEIQASGLGCEAEVLNLTKCMEEKHFEEQLEPFPLQCTEGAKAKMSMPLVSNDGVTVVETRMDSKGRMLRKAKRGRPSKFTNKKKQRMNTADLKTYEAVAYGVVADTNECTCKACKENSDFCRGCTCCLCMVVIQPEDPYSYITCPCNHVVHLECALKQEVAGVVNEKGLGGEAVCPSCRKRRSLIPFCRARVIDTLTSVNQSVIKENLLAANLVLKGTQRPLKAVQEELENALHLADELSFSQLQPLLLSLKDQLNTLQVLEHKTGLAVDSEVNETDIPVKEAVATSILQNKVELKGLKKPKVSMTPQKIVIEETQEQLMRAETQVAFKPASVQTIQDNAQTALKSFDPMHKHLNSIGFSGDEVDFQRKVLELEICDLQMLHAKIGGLNCLTKDFLYQLSALLEFHKVQQKRIDCARSDLADLLSFKRSA